MKLNTIHEWLLEWERLWDVPGLATRVQVRTNNRLRTSLGRCHPHNGRIDLHRGLWDEPDALQREVLCHEVAHAAAYLLHGPSIRPHGREWAALMRAAGIEPRARLQPARLSPSMLAAIRPRVLYRHRCLGCSSETLARRPVRRGRCRACFDAGLAGKLEITRVPSPA